MFRSLALPTLVGVLLVLTLSTPASAGHSETHVEKYEYVSAPTGFVEGSVYAYVDCSPQDATLGDPSCTADARRVNDLRACMPTLGWGCTKLI